MVLVRVIENGESVQAEVEFPIYAKSFSETVLSSVSTTVYRKIDANMNELRIIHRISHVEEHPVQDYWISDFLRGINFLNGAGVDYWTGRGEYACTKEEFEEAYNNVSADRHYYEEQPRSHHRFETETEITLDDILYGKGHIS
jgi:hypothetical protein